MKTCLVINGSGLHGAFVCGVLKHWVDNGITFPHIVATGFGSLAGAYFYAQQGDALEKLYGNFIDEYGKSLRIKGMLKGCDSTVNGLKLLDKAEPVDMDGFKAAEGRFSVATTCADNGDAKFWNLDQVTEWKHLKEFLRAGMTFPGSDQPVQLVERSYFDGRIAQPLPIKEALAQGSERVVVVQSHIAHKSMNHPVLTPAQAVAMRKYPKLHNRYLLSNLYYNDEMELLLDLENQRRAVVVAPQVNNMYYHRYNASPSTAAHFYKEGLLMAEARLDKVLAILGEQM